MRTDPREDALEAIQDHDFAEAERQLRAVVADEPDDLGAVAMLAFCVAEQGRGDEALRLADGLVADAPELALGHWARATLLNGLGRHAEALPAAREAARLDPHDPDHRAAAATAHAGLVQWVDVLVAAEQGLLLDDAHAPSARMRALALRALGRDAEAESAFEHVADLDPLDSFAAAGKGWSLLGRGQAGDAAPHFRDALLVDPGSPWAREGLVASLKARNPVYRALLRYFLWTASLTRGQRVAFLVGGMFAYRTLRRAAAAQPELAPVLWLLMGLYVTFVLLTWFGDPLFDLLLRLDPEGRRTLSRERRVASSWVGGGVATVAAIALAGVATGRAELQALAFAWAFVLLPLAGLFLLREGWPRRLMAGYTVVLALVGLLALAASPDSRERVVGVAVIGAVLGSWIVSGASALRRA